MPSLFVSHGAPTFALEPGLAGPKLSALGRRLARPRAVLVVSPHWVTRAPQVMTAARPVTLHDFSGFDPALYRIEYPAAGHPELANRTLELLHAAGWAAESDPARGLDHGAWVPLRYLYPDADVPAFQVSLPDRIDASAAVAFGRALAPLASEDVLVVGSGSLTHNLRDFFSGTRDGSGYAAEFTQWIRDAVAVGDAARLERALELAPHARRSHPTPEHFMPLLVAAGAAESLLPATLIDGGFAAGVLSMDAFVFADS